MPPILFDVQIKGVDRVITRFNKIIANTPTELNLGAKNLAEYGQITARQIVRENTNGNGALIASIELKTLAMTNKTAYTIQLNPSIANYGGYVNDGFTPHWVTIQDKPNLKAWIEKNIPNAANNHKIFIGGPNSAPWITEGLHFMEKAYAKMLGLTQEEFTNRIKKVIKG